MQFAILQFANRQELLSLLTSKSNFQLCGQVTVNIVTDQFVCLKINIVYIQVKERLSPKGEPKKEKRTKCVLLNCDLRRLSTEFMVSTSY